MNWLQFMRVYNPAIDSDTAEFLLWNCTAFPFSDLKHTVYQLRSAIRANKNKVKKCWACGGGKDYHKHYCPDI